jgi:hypothetical protein
MSGINARMRKRDYIDFGNESAKAGYRLSECILPLTER